MKRRFGIGIGIVAFGAALVAGVWAQQSTPGPMGPGTMPHGPMPHGQMPHDQLHGLKMTRAGIGAPASPGQDAFGTVAEIVRILDADPQTDWSRVDLERLRQHLIDMNEVVLRAEVKPSPVPAGLVMDVTGTGRTESAIRAMVVPHAAELDEMPGLAAKVEAIAGGVRLTVTVRNAEDARAVARVRGLGFVGLLTLGSHHQSHHLAMARGEAIGEHSQ